MLDQACYALVVLLWGLKRQPIAMCVLLCFVGLLRIGEALSLTWADLLMPDEHHSGAFVVIMLRNPKRAAINAHKVFPTNPLVISVLVAYKAAFHTFSQDRCFKFSYNTFARHYQRALQGLGLDIRHYKSHSLRRGGATALALAGWPLARICEAGRWESEKSAKLYVMRGEVLLIRARAGLSAEQWRRLECLARLLPALSFKLSDD